MGAALAGGLVAGAAGAVVAGATAAALAPHHHRPHHHHHRSAGTTVVIAAAPVAPAPTASMAIPVVQAMPQPAMLVVTVPQGVSAGMAMTVQSPDGQLLQVGRIIVVERRLSKTCAAAAHSASTFPGRLWFQKGSSRDNRTNVPDAIHAKVRRCLPLSFLLPPSR